MRKSVGEKHSRLYTVSSPAVLQALPPHLMPFLCQDFLRTADYWSSLDFAPDESMPAKEIDTSKYTNF